MMKLRNEAMLLLTMILLNSCLYASKKNDMREQNKVKILVIYDSKTGNTEKLAEAMAKGVRSYRNTHVDLKKVNIVGEGKKDMINITDLALYDGIAFGSPVYFSSFSAELKHLLDQTIELWKNQSLRGKPASIFMSSASGQGEELAIQAIGSSLRAHGMILMPQAESLKEKFMRMKQQGYELAKVASLLKSKERREIKNFKESIRLPVAPHPVGDYMPYSMTGKYIYINQIALKKGKVLYPGKVGASVTAEQAKEAVVQSTLNVLSVLKDALNGDLGRVKKVVQVTGFFNTIDGYKAHSSILNESSTVFVKFFGQKGKHARAAMGVSSLPLNSSNEIQVIFEIDEA